MAVGVSFGFEAVPVASAVIGTGVKVEVGAGVGLGMFVGAAVSPQLTVSESKSVIKNTVYDLYCKNNFFPFLFVGYSVRDDYC